jgi:hypothetical protein
MAEHVHKNVFLQVNQQRIEKLLYDIEIYKMQGSYGGNLNLAEIQTIIRSLSVQITNQAGMIFDLEKKLSEKN